MIDDVLQHDKFGQLLSQLNYLLCQCSGLLLVFLANGLVHLPTQIDDLAIRLGLGLVTANDADRVSCVRLKLGDVLLLTLRIERRCRNKQNRNDQQPVQMARSHQQASIASSALLQVAAIPPTVATDRHVVSSDARNFGVELVNRTSFPRHLEGQSAPYERQK
jgi:hypothetical protein